MAPAKFSGQHRIVVDWDGTCVPIVWPDQPEEFLPGTVEALREMLETGYEVVIFSTRLAPKMVDEITSVPRADKERERRYMRKMLDDVGLHEVGIWLKPWKPGGLAYVDDKGVHFDGDWDKALMHINRLTVHS